MDSETFGGEMANPLRYQDPGLVDTRCIGTLKKFDGADANWTLWSFQAESFFGIMPKPLGMNVDIEDLLDFSVGVEGDAETDMARMSREIKEVAKTIYHVLVQSVDGKALSVARRCEKHNGFLLWRMLHQTYAPKVGSRTTSMLIGLLAPDM